YLDMDVVPATLPAKSNQQPYQAKMVTINIDGGKKQKVRAGDILGCLTGKNGITGAQVGKIHLFPMRAYVAVEKSVAKKALQTISNGKMKGRQFRARLLK
ncbi:DbpA RNA binding domain-containing protein, partial [Vibrio owensii]